MVDTLVLFLVLGEACPLRMKHDVSWGTAVIFKWCPGLSADLLETRSLSNPLLFLCFFTLTRHPPLSFLLQVLNKTHRLLLALLQSFP